MAWYRSGTVNLTNGSAAVVGVGTAFIANVDVGEGILLADGRLYEVQAVTSDTSLTLGTPYMGSNTSGANYVVAPISGYVRDLAHQAATLVQNYSQAYANRITGVAGYTGNVTIAQLLTALKTVDGAGSGLDADLLDGKQASEFALINSPTLTGTPTAPTAAEGTNTTQLATTAFVLGNTENSLTSTSTTKALSAAMGNVLYNKTFDPSVKPTLSSDFKNDRHEVYENNRFVSKTVENTWSVTRSTTGTYVDPTGIIRTAAINVPRYTFESGVPKGLLVEEARTNLLSYSEDFSDNTVWTRRSGSAIGSNVITAPDGTLTADKHYNTDTTTNSSYIARTSAFALDNTVYCASMFVKRGSQSTCIITMYAKTSTADYAKITFNFDTETFTVAGVKNVTDAQGGVEKVGNGWFRVWLSANMLSGPGTSGAKFVPSFWGLPTAINSEYGYIWGAQLEVGSTPSSYIPTEASAVTRAADVVVRTLSAEFNPSEFSVFYDGGLGTGPFPSIFSIRNASETERVLLRRNEAVNATLSTNYRLLVVISDVATSIVVGNTLKKAVVTYKNGITKLYVDGQYKTQIEGVLNSNLFTQLVTSPKESVNSIKVYPSALTDAECVALTAL